MRASMVLAASLISATTVGAAEIRVDGTVNDDWDELRKITLVGKIVSGDARRLEQMIAEDDRTIVFLRSTGGDYREGLKLAQLFKSRQVRTMVDNGDTCYSACAIAFLGGSAYGEEGTQPFARAIAPHARLGYHAPFIEVADGELTADSVEAAYDHAIKTVTDFVRAAGGLGVSAEVAADMMTPQRTSLYKVETLRDLARIGIQLQGLGAPVALTASMARNLCINGWIAEGDTSWQEAAATMDGVLADISWPGDSTLAFRSGYFSFEPADAKRTVLPIAEAGEGSGYYACVIDHAIVDGVLHVSNRGYVLAELPDQIMRRAADFDTNPDEPDEPDARNQFGINVVDPLARNIPEDDLRYGVVPLDTRIEEIAATIANYIAREPAL